MPQLSLTDFVDIVSASGLPKATKVRHVKRRPPYNPAADFYKPIREGIIEIHKSNLEKNYIDTVVASLLDDKKKTAYPPIIQGYKKWYGRKSMSWYSPPNVIYSKHGVDVFINPELGLEIDGIPHLIKLYFKAEPLAKNRIDIITHLMSITEAELCPSPSNTVMSVLDIRRSKLFSPTVPIDGLTGILNAELSYIASLWPSL